MYVSVYVCMLGYAGVRVFERAPGWQELALLYMAETILYFNILSQSGVFSGVIEVEYWSHFQLRSYSTFMDLSFCS